MNKLLSLGVSIGCSLALQSAALAAPAPTQPSIPVDAGGRRDSAQPSASEQSPEVTAQDAAAAKAAQDAAAAKAAQDAATEKAAQDAAAAAKAEQDAAATANAAHDAAAAAKAAQDAVAAKAAQDTATAKAAQDVAAAAKATQDAATAKAAQDAATAKAAQDAAATAKAAQDAAAAAAKAVQDAAAAKAVQDAAAAKKAIALAEPAQVIARKKCHGFGLLTPLFGVSSRGVDRTNQNRRDELRLTGPIESGIGGGYYRSFGFSADEAIDSHTRTCNENVLVNWEVFGFSEGLNPSSTFQVGVGGGLGMTAWGKFQFGIALGYDLIRRETISNGGVSRTYSNGLLEWNDVTGCGTAWGGPDAARCAARNFTWLLTFGVTSSSGEGEKPQPNPEAKPK
jgi:hypothetical protein